ncbi:MAG: hypothetical protein ACLP7I_08235 [Limisphaerales bacterium]
MRTSPPNLLSNARGRDFFAWCLSFCFASLAMTAAAQSQSPDQNPNPGNPVVIPPDAQTQSQPAVQPPPPPDAWDRFWQIQKVSENDDWTRHFRLGAMVGLNISANFDLKNNITFSGKGAAQGNYDDGYVHPSGNGPYTSDWGYNNSSQYNAGANTLSMHQATSFSPTTGTSSEGFDSAFVGLDLAYGGNLWDWGSAKIGWDFGFGLLPISITDDLSLHGNVNRNVYVFDTTGIPGNLFPPAGYHGGPGGTWSINGSPSSTPTTDQVAGDIVGSRKLDVMLYTFRLGPSVYWDLNKYLGLSASAGPALGLVSGNLQYNETITTATTVNKYKGQVDATDVVYGGYVNATLMYHLEENGDLYLGVQYMPLGNATISGGGREAQLNLGGQVYITAGINWPF